MRLNNSNYGEEAPNNRTYVELKLELDMTLDAVRHA